MLTVTHLLGSKFMCKHHKDGHLDVHKYQTTFLETLVQISGLSHDISSVKTTPFRNGHSIDSVHHVQLPPEEKANLTTKKRFSGWFSPMDLSRNQGGP